MVSENSSGTTTKAEERHTNRPFPVATLGELGAHICAEQTECIIVTFQRYAKNQTSHSEMYQSQDHSSTAKSRTQQELLLLIQIDRRRRGRMLSGGSIRKEAGCLPDSMFRWLALFSRNTRPWRVTFRSAATSYFAQKDAKQGNEREVLKSN